MNHLPADLTEAEWIDAMKNAVAVARAVLADRDDDAVAILTNANVPALFAALVRMTNASGIDLHGSAEMWDAHLVKCQADLIDLEARL